MLPRLEKLAVKDYEFDDQSKRAFVFLCLLRLKPYDDLEDFKDWFRQVTGYDQDNIATFAERATEGFLIVDGQPNAEAFDALAADEATVVEVVLMTKVLEGKFRRTSDGKYGLSEATV
jgi:hypothetical protein